MGYLSQRFPIDIAPGPMGGPTWSTDVTALRSGEEQRNENWSRSRHEYEASHGIKTADDFVAVGAHFRMARGRAHMFRYKDHADFIAERGEGVLTLITSTTFQLYKQYGSVVGFVEDRKITRPVAGTLQVWKDDVLTAVTLNAETGVVTFGIAPGAAVLECAFEFDVPVRYDTDKLQATLVHYNEITGSLHSWASVPLVEVRE
ncbi:MAG TPA: DUF2460 domain-containing protein [Burkholderiaceae bacterium]|nr:DUF2460 domain-containing protein [Burkholderiaceae bacterium]